MDSLVSKLEREVGLTSEQARKTVDCVKNYLSENDLTPDWEEFFERKFEKIADKTKNTYNQVVDKTQTLGGKIHDLADKAGDVFEDLSDKTAKKVKDLRNKAADFISDKD